MGVGYYLANIDKKQIIHFYKVDSGNKVLELSGTVIASTIVTYYLLTNIGDRIGFINDTESSYVVCGQKYPYEYFKDFEEVTDKVIEELIKKDIIKDNGIVWIDKEEDSFYRDLINIFDPHCRNI